MSGTPSAVNLFANPILRRYRRAQMRFGRLAVSVILTLVISGFLTAITFLPLHYRVGYPAMDAARMAFLPLLGYQAIILMVFGTAAVGAGILRESEEGMVEYQRLTPLAPLTKVLGYLFGLPIRQYAAFAVSAGFSAFSIIVGRIQFEAWGSVYLALFSAVILYHLLGLMTGLVIKSRWRAGLVSLGLVLLLNFVLPRLAVFGFSMFSHLTIWPVVGNYLPDLVPTVRDTMFAWVRRLGTLDVQFWNWRLSHLGFALLVQGSLAITFFVMLVRRWRDEKAHLLGKGYALGFLVWLQALLLGNVLPLFEGPRVLASITGARNDAMLMALKRLSVTAEASVLAVLFGIISLLAVLPIVSCMTPRESTQMVALRRRKKFGLRNIPWFSDGATATPFVWLAALVTGGAWTYFVQQLFGSPAYGGLVLPREAWAIFIGTIFVTAGIFHFLLEAYGRRVAWLTLFLVGFIPLFTSLVLISIRADWADMARYIAGISPLGAPWQPLQWLRHWRASGDPAMANTVDFGPFVFYCGLQGTLWLALLIGWIRQRRKRVARA